MQKVPSNQSTKSNQQNKSSEVKTSSKLLASDDKTSSSAKQGDETKRPADNTDHTTVSTSFCGCKKDKCDAFFDKLLCYLEKQSDIIAKCCTNNREHRKSSIEKLMNCQVSTKPNKNETTDKCIPSQDKPPVRHPSPCKDHAETNSRLRPSVETQKSVKGKGKDKFCDSGSDSDSKLSRYKSQLDVGGNRPLKLGDKPCNIYVEVCSCKKCGRKPQPTRSLPKPLDEDSDESKQRSENPPKRQTSGKSSEYGIDCHGCEKKVSYFFKLAEEICQGYMKQCQEQDTNPAHSKYNHSNRKRNSREDFGNQAPSRPYQAQPCDEGSDENYMRPEKLSAHEYEAYIRPHARPIAIEVECQGTKEEFIVEPCQCESRHTGGSYERGKPFPVPSRMEYHKKSCLEVFEERYGKMLRDLHTKLFPDPNLKCPPAYPPQGNPQQVYPPQGYPPQGDPQQGYPSQGYPPQGPQQGYPRQGYPPQDDPQQGYPSQGYPQQGNPPQGDPQQGYPSQGYPPQGNPPKGNPPQGNPQQGYPRQGYPPQGNPQQGFSSQGYPPPGYAPPSYSNPYGDAASQQPGPQQPPPAAPKQEPNPPPKQSKQSEGDDSSEDKKKHKKKDKKEEKKMKKKKGSNES